MAKEFDLLNTVGSMCEYLEKNGVQLLVIARKDDELMVGYTNTENMDILLWAAMNQIHEVEEAVNNACMMNKMKNESNGKDY